MGLARFRLRLAGGEQGLVHGLILEEILLFQGQLTTQLEFLLLDLGAQYSKKGDAQPGPA